MLLQDWPWTQLAVGFAVSGGRLFWHLVFADCTAGGRRGRGREVEKFGKQQLSQRPPAGAACVPAGRLIRWWGPSGVGLACMPVGGLGAQV